MKYFLPLAFFVFFFSGCSEPSTESQKEIPTKEGNLMISNTTKYTTVTSKELGNMKKFAKKLYNDGDCTAEELSFGWTKSTRDSRNVYFMNCENYYFNGQVYYEPNLDMPLQKSQIKDY